MLKTNFYWINSVSIFYISNLPYICTSYFSYNPIHPLVCYLLNVVSALLTFVRFLSEHNLLKQLPVHSMI